MSSKFIAGRGGQCKHDKMRDMVCNIVGEYN